MFRKTLIIFALFIFQVQYGQIPVEWAHYQYNVPHLSGWFLGGSVELIQENVGSAVSFTSSYPSPLLFAADIHHFTTFGIPNAPPSKKITFNFSRPVVISRLNIGDINLSDNHNDAFFIRGITFTSVTSNGEVNTTLNSATPIRNGAGNAIWHLSTTPITTFSIEYAVTNSKTHSFLTYALEVMLPGLPGGSTGIGSQVEICPDEPTVLNADTPVGGNFSYIWSVPPGFPNPGNTRSLTTTRAGYYSVLATDLTTGNEYQVSSWAVRYKLLINSTFINLPTSICPNKLTLNAPFPSTSMEGIPGQWAQTSVNENDVEYTFTPNPGLCGKTATHIVPVVGITPVFLPPNAVCNIKDIQLPTTSLNAITGNWTLVSSDEISAIYKFTPAPNQCALETQVTVEILRKNIPYFNIATPECITSNFDFPTTSVNLITGKWQMISEDSEKSTYEFTPDDLNCNDKITIEILKLQIPEFDIPTTICNLSELTLETTSKNGYEGVWSLVSQTSRSLEYLFTPDAFCVSTVKAIINIQAKTIPLFDPITVNCKFDEDQLPHTSKNDVNGKWHLTNETGNLLTYTFTPSIGQCATQTTMEIVNASVMTLNFDPQCINDQLFLTVKLTADNQFVNISEYKYYYKGKLVSDKDKLNITALNIQNNDLPLKFDVEVTQENGCEASGSIIIDNLDCFIPNGISPGNDLINDKLDLKNFKISKLSIFNRMGRLVYEKINYKDEWYGQSNAGHLLPSATYFYQIEFKNEMTPRTGWIQLVAPK